MGEMSHEEEWAPVFRQVIVRALCDALGFTNLPHGKEEHRKTVNEARSWFFEDSLDFKLLCDLSELDSFIVRKTAMDLIHARQSGDFTKVPDFWRHVFKGRRVPNLTNIDRALAKSEKAE